MRITTTPINAHAHNGRSDLAIVRNKRTLLHPQGVPVASGGHDSDVNFPPPDIDEAAGFIGRLPFFGAIIGRLLILGGGLVATHAASHARHDIVDDWKASRALRKAARELADTHAPAAQAPFSDKSRRRNRAAMARLVMVEAPRKVFSAVMNGILAIGSAGMGVNLLAGAEIAGAIVQALVPAAEVAMAIAVPFMGVFGALAAYRAGSDWLRHRREIQALEAQINISQGSVREALQQRVALLRTVQRLDLAIVASGILQAVGAPLQAVIGPLGLLVLLPGTFGLGIFKFKRDTMLVDSQLLPLPNPDTLGNKRLIAEKVLAAHDARVALTTGRASAWGLLRTADGNLKAARAALKPAPAPIVPPYKASRFTRDMGKDWCQGQITHLQRERAVVQTKAATWTGARERILAIDASLQTLTGLAQDLAVTIPNSAQATTDLVKLLVTMDLFKPFAVAALQNQAVRKALQTPWDGDHYWMEAAYLPQRVAQLPVREAAILVERLHEAAREVLWGPGAFLAARDEANLGAILQERVLGRRAN